MKKKKKMGETITANSTEGLSSSTLTVDSSTLSGTVSSSGAIGVGSTTIGGLSSSVINWAQPLSSATGNLYYMDFDPWQKATEPSRPLTDEELDKVVEKVLDKEEDFMPIFRRYLTKYLDGILDDPSELVKDVIKEKDEEINRLRDQVGQLEEKLKSLSDKVDRMDSMNRPLGGWDDLRLGSAAATWVYDSSSSSSNIISSTTPADDSSSITTTTTDYLNSAANTYEYSTLKSMLANANTTSSTDSSA
jgi:hypothetical protein